MIYENIKPAVFLDRPNRFIAHIELDGKIEICHVKNTGRCRELLITGAQVLVQESDNPARKTKFDLISVYKGERLIQIDSQAPNRIFAEWVQTSGIFRNMTCIKAEQRFENSRFDFYIEADGKKIFVEVKGATLEQDGIARFPDAPTERGVKHLNELISCTRAGYDAYVVFVVQMKDVLYFEPNWETHPAFGFALQKAKEAGVKILAVDCHVTETAIIAGDPVEVRI